MNKIKCLMSVLLLISLTLGLCACGSGAQASEEAELDVSVLLESVFDHDFGEVMVNIKDGRIDITSSMDAINTARKSLGEEPLDAQTESAEEAVEEEVTPTTEPVKNEPSVVGVWEGSVDVSNFIVDIYASSDMKLSLDAMMVPTTLCFCDDGLYTIKFDSKSLPAIKTKLNAAAAISAKQLLKSKATGASKLVINSIGDDVYSDVMSYLSETAIKIFTTGFCGEYEFDGKNVKFDGEQKSAVELHENEALIFKDALKGDLRILTDGKPIFTKK